MSEETIDNRYIPEVTYIELHILVELCYRNLHGLGFIQAIAERTNDEIFLSPGTLYTALKRLYKNGLISGVEVDFSNENVDGNALQRRYYEITPRGRSAIASELQRMGNLCQLAHNALGTVTEANGAVT